MRKIISVFIIVIAGLSLTACSTNRQVPTDSNQSIIHVGSSSSPDPEKLRGQLRQNARSSASKSTVEGALVGDVTPGIVVVGNVGSLREIPANAKALYYQKIYLPTAKKLGFSDIPELSESQFIQEIAAYTSLTIWSVPGMLNSTLEALVRENDIKNIEFPTARAVYWFKSTGDLVAARSNMDGVVIVERVLCKSSSSYGECAANYTRGKFDANTGQELSSDLSPKNGGARIDTTTYKVVPKT